MRIGPRKLATRVLDRNFFKTLGYYRTFAASDEETPVLDWSGVEWGDATSLLVLGATLGSYKNPKSRFKIKLGERAKSTDEHRIFLKFFADQGFLEAYAKFSDFEWTVDGNRIVDIPALKEHLVSFPKSTNLRGADCIHAKLISIEQFKSDVQLFENFIEELMREARVRLRNTAFGEDPYVRDRIFQKLRKLLFELILNIVEHAYPDAIDGYAAIYVRVRTRRPSRGDAARAWDDIWKRENTTALVNKQIELDVNADWLEIFICDAGRGLVADLPNWKTSKTSSPELIKAIRTASRSTHKLFSIGHQLFKLPLSRFDRKDDGRPAITGLQFLGHMLGLDEDFCKIYTEGQWLGARHPWAPDAAGSREFTVSENSAAALGTTFVILLQPAEQPTSYPSDTWQQAEPAVLKSIVETLEDTVEPAGDSFVFDRREVENQSPPSQFEKPAIPSRASTIILRPRRNLTKNAVAKWIEAFAGTMGQEPSWAVENLIIAELTPSQAIILAEAIKRFIVSDGHAKHLYLVSEEFAVCCLSTSGHGYHLYVDHEKASSFLNKSLADGIPTARSLVLHLRKIDSSIFWSQSSERTFQQFYMHGRINWDDGIELSGYLDLSAALTDPLKYRACRRALRRVLQLLPSSRAAKADDIVSSLLADVTSGSYRTRNAKRFEQTIPVGSVSVTSRTIGRHLQRFGSTNGQAVVLFVHADGTIAAGSRKPLAALLWDPPPVAPGQELKSYSRIPDTPFVAERGEKSIPIVRFRATEFPNEPFSDPFYPRGPSDTYTDFLKYRALKLGHWNYGGRHDLLTVNLSQVVDYSILERGPLIEWLKTELYGLFVDSNGGLGLPAVLMVYPSHEVTDQIIQFIKTDGEFIDALGQAEIIPIKFIGSHSVSPLLASPSTIQEIKDAVLRSGRSLPATVIFDDAAVSGKHLRELTQVLKEAGSGTVYTLALLDRTGLPVREGVMEDFLRRHRRYWRWDVPTIGHGRDCILCAALRRIHAMREQPILPPYRHRLNEWIDDWSPTNVSEEWHTRGLMPAIFENEIKITFGLSQQNGVEYRNEVSHKSSTGLAAMVVELTRLTTKADTALSKSNSILALMETSESKSNFTQTIIEIICSQLIIFFDELSYWQKVERYWLLISILWTSPLENKATSFAGICFSLIPDEIANEIWRRCVERLFHSEILHNSDVVLCAQLVSSRVARLGIDRRENRDLTEAARQNYLLLSNAESYKRTIVNIFTVIGFRSSQSHETTLRSYLTKLSDGQALSSIDTAISFAEVRRLLQSLAGALEKLDGFILSSTESQSVPDVHSDFKSISEFLTKSNWDIATTSKNVLSDWAVGVREWLFGSGNLPGVSQRYQQHFFRRIARGKIRAAFLSEEIKTTHADWEKIHEEKIKTTPFLNWYDDTKSLVKPDVRCGVIETWDDDLDVFFDALVRESIRDFLTNVFHAEGQILNPWDTKSKTRAHMWWRAKVEKGYLNLEFSNATRDARVRLKPSAPLAGLARIGGTFDLQIGREMNVQRVTVTMRIPLADTLVREI